MIPDGEERDSAEVALSNLLDWLKDLSSGRYGLTVMSDSGFSLDLKEGMDVIESLIEDWYD